MREYLFILMVAAIITYAATPAARWVAVRLRAYTPVRDRDVHSVPIPRLGGVAMFAGFLAACLVAHQLPFLHQVFLRGDEVWGVLAGAAVVCLVGAIDDVRELGALTKLAGQLIAAGIMAYRGIQLISLPLGETTVLPPPLLILITVVVVVFTTNAVNFVDGLDGLAVGVVGIAAGSFFVYSYLISRDYSPANVFTTSAFVSAAIVGICLGFLPHNFYPARIFMGDSGALLLGVLLAASIIMTGSVSGPDVSTNSVVAAVAPMALPIAILLFPFLDVVLAVIRRTRAGQRPWQPDAQHLHHRMLRLGHGHRRAVLLLWAWALVVATGAVSFVVWEPKIAIGIVLIGLAAVGLLTAVLPRLTFRGRRPQALQ